MGPDRITCFRPEASRDSAEDLSVLDFVKVITVQELSRAGLRKIAPSILALAEAEGLQGPCPLDRS